MYYYSTYQLENYSTFSAIITNFSTELIIIERNIEQKTGKITVRLDFSRINIPDQENNNDLYRSISLSLFFNILSPIFKR